MSKTNTVEVGDISEYPILSNLHGHLRIGDLTLDREVDRESTSDSLFELDTYSFRGDDQDKKTRRPQGAAFFKNYLVNSWYFRKSKFEDNCKLTVTDTETCRCVNVAPVQTSGDKLVKIESHAGGIATIDHWLFLADSTIQAIRVFDLQHIYPVDENDSCILSDQEFVRLYDYMVPEIGRVPLSTPGSASLAYISIATIDCQLFFLVGNFYSRMKPKYKKGGKSMIWLFPIETSQRSFPSVDLSRPNLQLEPLFPSGPSGTVTRIQGALINDDVLTLSRSFSYLTKQLIVMRYDDILSSSTPKDFFDGTVAEPHEYDNKNWLYGCEDLSFDEEFKNVTTVTEFAKHRHSFLAPYSRFLNLLPT
jgi:hypothetical protein